MSLQNQIHKLVEDELKPSFFELNNESEAHHGHRPNSTNESHFSAIIVSEKFVGVPRVKRQQMVYAIVEQFMEAKGGTLHALSLRTLTPEEWQAEQH